MNKFWNKGQHVLNKHLGFFIFAVALFWAKTYAAYLTSFNLGIENGMQKFLLFFNPAGSAVLFLGLALYLKGRRAYIGLFIINFLLSFILYANIVYYRFFNDFITLPTLTQTDNFGSLGGSIFELLKGYDVLFFLDTIIIGILVFAKIAKPAAISLNKRKRRLVFVSAVVLLLTNVALAEIDRPQLLTRTFDRNYLVKYLGAYNYTIYDAVQNMRTNAQKASADTSDLTDVLNYENSMYAKPDPKTFGKAKGMNVIYIHLESMQNFMIDYKLNGEEVTPYLNSFVKDKNTMYFDNFFHQTGQGKTSDAEFMLENSLFGLPQGSAFTTNGGNTYQAAPAILGQKGYESAVFHGNNKTFWNRDEAYKSFGYDNFFDAGWYDMNEKDVQNYGLKDKPFFEQSKPMLENMKQPFYSKFITVSHHFPYPISEEEATIGPHTTGDGSVDRYFQTARYQDESVEGFMNYLKETGLYDNSVIVMYGDHYGISENHNDAMSKVLGKEVGSFENAQLQRVPLMIRVPGMEGGVKHQYGGQIDLMPTLMHLLGIDTKDYVQFGTDLLSPQHQQVVPFRNGNFVTPEVTGINGKYFNTVTGEPVQKNEMITQTEEQVETKLKLSDKVVQGDLLRFHKPKGFKKVDRSKYNYNNPEKE
ncbi:LTA synthase family protein [Fictibacillus aquaticus]|uniref:Glycerol phosphate lipoteichoic acid synthase n=1 Tax=Fictibacillus aquaticus TaxID=2021314 RepID=A0A235FE79_9BACL|nr:LTA synthase family protein [Fictibacillus aquaticus]OYD59283.1 glycerol phosphate lipoteichoic acid synthase [Fictibacillus aquaticus]